MARHPNKHVREAIAYAEAQCLDPDEEQSLVLLFCLCRRRFMPLAEHKAGVGERQQLACRGVE